MNSITVSLALLFCSSGLLAQDFKECKTLDIDEYFVARYKDGFIAKKKGDFVFITKSAETKLFKDSLAGDKAVTVTGTVDGRYALFVNEKGITVVNVANKKTINYPLNGSVSHGRLQVLNDYAYGVLANTIFRISLSKKEIIEKPLDAGVQWLGTWQVGGKIYIYADDGRSRSGEPAYVLPVDEKLNIGERIFNLKPSKGFSDGPLNVHADDSGWAGSYGTEQIWVIDFFKQQVVNKVPRWEVDSVVPYQGYVYARKKGGGEISIYRNGSDEIIQRLTGVHHLINMSSSGNEMIAKTPDDTVHMFCR